MIDSVSYVGDECKSVVQCAGRVLCMITLEIPSWKN